MTGDSSKFEAPRKRARELRLQAVGEDEQPHDPIRACENCGCLMHEEEFCTRWKELPEDQWEIPGLAVEEMILVCPKCRSRFRA